MPTFDLKPYSFFSPAQTEFAAIIADFVNSGDVREDLADQLLKAYSSSGYVSDFHKGLLPPSVRMIVDDDDSAKRYHIGALWRRTPPRLDASIGRNEFQKLNLDFLQSPPRWASDPFFSTFSPGNYADLFAIILKVENLLNLYQSKITSPHLKEGKKGLQERISLYRDQNRRNVEEAARLSLYPDDGYREDLLDRVTILKNRILDLGRHLGEVLDEYSPFPEISERHGALKTLKRPGLPPRRLLTNKDESDESNAPDRKTGRRFPSLVNRAYPGMTLKLRDYQQEALRSFESDLMRAHHFGHNPDDFEGTIVLPTGAGKTRLMSGMMAVVALRGKFKLGDKIIVTTHLKSINDQNLTDIAKNFSEDFKNLFKRDLKISRISEGVCDLSGDIVVMSIPAVGQEYFPLEEKLKDALNGGNIPLVLMDEVHHAEAQSWKRVRERIRRVAPTSYVAGLTATPSGAEPNLIYQRNTLELMKRGVLPSIEIVEVRTGIRLDGIRPKTEGSKDFNAETLEEATNTPMRNRKVMEALEAYGIRGDVDDRRLASTLITAVDRKHAYDMALTYRSYFGRSDVEGVHSLRNRKITIIGCKLRADGKVIPQTQDEILDLLKARDEGRVDALVAVITGDLKEIRGTLYDAWKSGLIEAAISAKTLGEGFDGWFVQNLVGAKATLSAIEKTQEAGRISRRGPGEVDVEKGQILKNIRRRAIDMRDDYSGNLQTYRLAYGYKHKTIPANTAWDMIQEQPVEGGGSVPLPVLDEQDDRHGKDEELDDKPHRMLNPEIEWMGTLGQLKKILHLTYHDDMEEMAFDLGLPPEELESILAGSVKIEAHLELARRLATLLYLDRGALEESYLKDLAATRDASKEYLAFEALRRGLDIYLAQKKIPLGEPFDLPIPHPDGEQRLLPVTRNILKRIYQQPHFLRLSFTLLAQGLTSVFRNQGEHDLAVAIEGPMDAAFGNRLRWDRRLDAFQRISLDQFLDINPELKAELLQNSDQEFHLVGSSIGAVRIARGMRVVGYFDLKKTPPESRLKIPYVTLVLERDLSPTAGSLPFRIRIKGDGGNNAETVGRALMAADWADGPYEDLNSFSYRLKQIGHVDRLKELGPDFLLGLYQEQFKRVEPKPSDFYLCAGNHNGFTSEGNIYSELRLETEPPPEGQKIPYVALRIIPPRKKDLPKETVLKPTIRIEDEGGSRAFFLRMGIEEAGWALSSQAFRLKRIKGLDQIKTLGSDFLHRLYDEKFGDEEPKPKTFYLVTSAPTILYKNGRISGHLKMSKTRPADKRAFLTLEYGHEASSSNVPPQKIIIRGNAGGYSEMLGRAVEEAGWAKGNFTPLDSLAYRLGNTHSLKGLRDLGKDFLHNLYHETFPGPDRPKNFYFAGSSGSTIYEDGTYQGSFSLSLSPSEGKQAACLAMHIDDRTGQIVIDSDQGSRGDDLAATLVAAGWATGDYPAIDSMAYRLREVKTWQGLKELGPDFLSKFYREACAETEGELSVFYLTGSSVASFSKSKVKREGSFYGFISLRTNLDDVRGKPHVVIRPMRQKDKKGQDSIIFNVIDEQGMQSESLKQAIVDAGWAVESLLSDGASWPSASFRLEKVKNVNGLKSLGPDFLKDFYEESFEGQEKPVRFYFVGSSDRSIYPDGRLSGIFSISRTLPADNIPFLELSWLRENRSLPLVLSNKGTNVELLTDALEEAGWVLPSEAFRLRQTHSLTELKRMGSDFIRHLYEELCQIQSQRLKTVYLAASSHNAFKDDADQFYGYFELKAERPSTRFGIFLELQVVEEMRSARNGDVVFNIVHRGGTHIHLLRNAVLELGWAVEEGPGKRRRTSPTRSENSLAGEEALDRASFGLEVSPSVGKKGPAALMVPSMGEIDPALRMDLKQPAITPLQRLEVFLRRHHRTDLLQQWRILTPRRRASMIPIMVGALRSRSVETIAKYLGGEGRGSRNIFGINPSPWFRSAVAMKVMR